MKKSVPAKVAPAEVVVAAETVVPAEVAATGTQLVVANQPEPQPEVVQLERVDQPEPQPEVAQPQVVLPKCARAKSNKGVPQAKMLRKIVAIRPHPGVALRIKRYHLYSVGLTLQDCKETEGLDHLDVQFYVEHNLMVLDNPTEDEVKARTELWLKKHSEGKAA